MLAIFYDNFTKKIVIYMLHIFLNNTYLFLQKYYLIYHMILYKILGN